MKIMTKINVTNQLRCLRGYKFGKFSEHRAKTESVSEKLLLAMSRLNFKFVAVERYRQKRY